MNAMTSSLSATRFDSFIAQRPSPRSVNLATTSTYQPRGERAFGAGYGRSQGYAAAQRSYLSSPRPSLFRVV